ncbi:MAG TPA: TldD/PmbA family protein [Gaiellaceae bacterium]|nr:TldD/PmbA family protein [Gaiellaceae bacterium]
MSGSALELAEHALSLAGADGAEVVVTTERSGFARFAAGEVHQPTLIDDAVVQLRVVDDGRSGAATTNRLDDAGLAELARRAAQAAAGSDRDPDLPPLAPPADYPAVDGFDEATAALGADDQARLADAAIAASGSFGLYGFYTSGVTELAIASSTGLRAYERSTDATCRALAAADGASGYAERTAWRADAIDPASVAQEAAAKAERTRGAVDAPPDRYRAVLEPYAIAELLYYSAFDMFNGQALLEERSWFAGRIGERAFDPKVTLVDDALDPNGLPRAFDFEGTPKQRVVLVEEGVVRDTVWDRGTAARAGRASTGHGLPLEARSEGAVPTSVALAPGEAGSTDELAELVGDGIYVTRLHYLGVVNPREGVVTGMTKDGTFRIRGGRIAEPLVNLRFTVAMPELLADVPGLTRETLLVNQSDFYDARWAYAYRVPAIATACFNVTGSGSGPGL